MHWFKYYKLGKAAQSYSPPPPPKARNVKQVALSNDTITMKQAFSFAVCCRSIQLCTCTTKHRYYASLRVQIPSCVQWKVWFLQTQHIGWGLKLKAAWEDLFQSKFFFILAQPNPTDMHPSWQCWLRMRNPPLPSQHTHTHTHTVSISFFNLVKGSTCTCMCTNKIQTGFLRFCKQDKWIHVTMFYFKYQSKNK